MCTVLGFYNLYSYIPLYLSLHQFEKAVKRAYSNESESDSSRRANVIVVGPIPADNTSSGKSSVFRRKGWNFKIYFTDVCLRALCVFMTSMLTCSMLFRVIMLCILTDPVLNEKVGCKRWITWLVDPPSSKVVHLRNSVSCGFFVLVFYFFELFKNVLLT